MRTLLAVLLALVAAAAAAQEEPPAAAEEPLAVAMLRYGGGKSGECFADRFLGRFNEATDAEVAPEMARVEARALDAAAHRVAILTGEGPFRFADGEAEALRAFAEAGGLLIVSTGCSDPGWTSSLEEALPSILPRDAGGLAPLPVEHPAFQRIFRVETSTYAKGPPRLPLLRGTAHASGRLAVVWSPEGLNDTLGVEGPCCCCGGNEVRAAEELLVNLLAIGFDADAAAE